MEMLSGDSEHSRLGLVRVSVAVVLAVLLLQFLVGMWLNLFATFPNVPSAYSGGMAGMMSFMFSGGMSVLMIHMMTGYLILALAVVALAASASAGRTSLAALAAGGLVSVVLAGASGLYFMYSGFANEAYSYLMAVGYVLAFSFYFVELLLVGLNIR